MSDNGIKRQLKAIFSADVKGYSKLMGDDDEATVQTITAYRNIIASCIEKHMGRVVDSPGDNILAEFKSALAAVNSAIEIQKILEEENHKRPQDRRMNFRIGINLGDILHKDDRIYGDGVNVAARIESLADPGGICISRGVFDQVKRKVSQGFEYLGEHNVKNISEPVRIYRILLAPEHKGQILGEQINRATASRKTYAITLAVILICSAALLWMYYPRQSEFEPASEDRMAFVLPDKPSIAVLPFKNIGGGQEYDYFSDGLTDEIIIALSKVPRLFIIARNSMFTYKGKSTLVTQVSEDLGVRYILEGNIRTSSDRVRISVQLIDALEGYQLWAERYDKELNDIFAIYDEITQKVILAMEVTLTKGEKARLLKKGTENIEAYLKVLQGTERFFRMNNIDNAAARELFLEAIDLDENYPVPYAYVARTHLTDVWLRVSMSPTESIRRGFQYAQKAIALDNISEIAHLVLAGCYLLRREHQKAIEAANNGMSISPNSADIHLMLGQVLAFSDRPQKAIENLEMSIRLDPFARSQFFHMLGMAYREAGRYDEAIDACQEAIRRQRNNMFAHLILAATYVMNNQPEEARNEAAEVLRIDPSYSLDRLAEIRPHIDPENTKRFINALRKAGLK